MGEGHGPKEIWPAGTNHAPDVERRPKVTFGVIVLNGEPFTRYTLRALYPFAHEIIVVEGAAPAARTIATSDGHSRDGTLETLREFQASEDPEGKVRIVTAEDDGHPNGFWPGEKDEQSQAYARRATGSYLWQVDIDEFYRAEDMRRVLDMLHADDSITGMSFKQIAFWGGLDYVVDGWYLLGSASRFRRLFKWKSDYVYLRHRPPTVVDERGDDLRSGHWLTAETLSERGIRLYHYALLFPKQVLEKCEYYDYADWDARTNALGWANDAFLNLRRPFRVHNAHEYPSWLRRYRGPQPDEPVRMMADLRATGAWDLRSTNDIDRMLDSWWYPLGRTALRVAYPLNRHRPAILRFRELLRRALPASVKGALKRLLRGRLRSR
jgi:hypothetical protein